jgi:thiamine-phosphate pyrophosphorylase
VQSPRVLLITDPAFSEDVTLRVIQAVSAALPVGAFAVHLRDKVRDRSVRAAFAWRVREVTMRAEVPLIVNGDEALARDVGAEGFHSRRPPVEPGFWRSVAAHSDKDVERAMRASVDAVLVSPIFDSPGKGDPRGVAALSSARAIAGEGVAIFALGGVDVTNARACFEAGADGVAVIRALLGAADPAAVARALYDAAALAKSPRGGADVLTSD